MTAPPTSDAESPVSMEVLWATGAPEHQQVKNSEYKKALLLFLI